MMRFRDRIFSPLGTWLRGQRKTKVERKDMRKLYGTKNSEFEKQINLIRWDRADLIKVLHAYTLILTF